MSPLLHFRKTPLFHQIRSLSTLHSKIPESPNPKSNLSARLSFVFDQIDAIDNQTSEKFDALQRIRQWRESRAKNDENCKISSDPNENTVKLEEPAEKIFSSKMKEVEVVHPWKEWIELMERLGHQNYFDCGRRASEEMVAESVGINLSEVTGEVGFDFSRDWTTVRNACMNFGKDRFDILRSLSKKDLQILVGHGCPSMDPKVVFSAKLLRKYTHLDEGDVCSACSLRNSCSRGYILTLKEDEARTLDVMRVLLTYGFDHVNGAVENKPLMQMKSVKTVVRKLLHEIVKLSAIPIDPNLPPPVIKKPPPKVKQPPPQPKKRVGRDDVEMKKGDWLCSKCDFMNFAKNTACLQCDAKRPKRQLLPGEWECPQCNFLNYRRNMACFHCDAKRPPDDFTDNQFQPKQAAPRTRLDRAPTRVQDISDAWNFDFDDNESDGADVAAFEFADSAKGGNITDLDDLPHARTPESLEDDTRNTGKSPRAHERSRYLSGDNERKSTLCSDRAGFDDFDDEEDDDLDSYELDGSNNSQPSDVSKRSFSEIENSSGSEDFDGFEDDELADHPKLKSSHDAESWKKSGRRGRKSPLSDDDIELDSDDDDDDDMNSGFGSKQRKNHQRSLGSRGIGRQGRDSGAEDDLLLDSDSDGDDNISYSSRNKLRGNKGFSDRRGSDFRKSNDFAKAGRGEFNRRGSDFGKSDDFARAGRGEFNRRGSDFGKSNDFANARRGEFRSDDRKKNNRRNALGDQDDDFSYRGSRRDGNGGRRENNRSEHFDRLDDGFGRHDRYKGSRRENNRFEHFDKSDDGKRRQDRSNQFNDRPRGSRRDDRGTRGSGYMKSRGDGGFRRESANNYRDRSRSFEDNSNSDRPRRRVIER